MYIEQNLDGLGFSFRKAVQRAVAPVKKVVTVAKKVAAPQVAIAKKIAAPQVAIAKKIAAPQVAIAKKIAAPQMKIAQKVVKKIEKPVGKILRPVAKVVAFVPGWVGAVAGGMIALDKVASAKRQKKLEERQSATTQAEIDRIDAEIRAIEAGGAPIDSTTKIPVTPTANAIIGAKTATYGAGSENISYSSGGGAPLSPIEADKPGVPAPSSEEPKKIPWGLIAPAAIAVLTMFK